jgi:uncharacterized membrane protein
MDRILLIDNMRGMAFLMMVIQHIPFFYDLSNNNKTNYNNNIIIEFFGSASRTLFILLAGISIGLFNKKPTLKNTNRRIKRSIEIALHALIITIVTYICYPKYFIRFGILHFLAIATLICSFIAPNKSLTIIILILTILYKPPIINPLIDTITGAKAHYNMMDWFGLFPWLSLLLSGVIIGQNINKFKSHILTNKILNNDNILTKIGQNSLELYTGHILLLIIFFSLKNKLIKKN